MNKTTILLIMLFVLYYLPKAGATDVYVETLANGGNDANPGTQASPVATIQQAASMALYPGDVIYIGEGVFTEVPNISIAKGVDVTGAGMDKTFIYSATPTESPLFILEWRTVEQMEPGNQVLKGFTVDGTVGGTKKAVKYGIEVKGRHNVKVYNVRFREIENTGLWIYSGFAGTYTPTFAKGIEVAYCEFINCGYSYASGHISGMLELNQLEGADIHHNYFYNVGDPYPGKGIEVRLKGGWLKRSRIHNNYIDLESSYKANKWYPIALETTRLICETEIYNNYMTTWTSFVKMNNDAVSETYGSTPSSEKGDYALIFHHNVINYPETAATGAQAIELSDAGDYYGHHNYVYHPNGSAYQFSWSGMDGDAVNDGAISDIYHNYSRNVRVENDVLVTPDKPAFSMNAKNDNGTLEHVRFFNNTMHNAETGFKFGDGYVDKVFRTDKDVEIKNNIFHCTQNGVQFTATNKNYEQITLDNNLFLNMPLGKEIVYDMGSKPAEVTVSNTYIGNEPGLNLSGDKPVPFFRPSSSSSWVVGKGIDLGNPADTSIGAYNYIEAADVTAETPVPLFPEDQDTIVLEDKPVFSWLIHSDESGIEKYEIGINGTVYNAGASSSFIPTTALADGDHTWKVRAVDSLGNISEWSTIMNVHVSATDIIPPPVPSVLLPKDSISTYDSYPLVYWEKVNDVSGIARYEADVEGTIYNMGNGTHSKVPDSLAAGNYNLKLRAVDSKGNVSPWSESRYLTILEKPTATTIVEMPPVEDTYIFGGDRGDDLYGVTDQNRLIVKHTEGNDKYTGYTLLKFDLSAYSLDMISATLQYTGATEGEKFIGVDLGIFNESDTIWDEETATWNTINPDYSSQVPYGVRTVNSLEYIDRFIPASYYIDEMREKGKKEFTMVIASLATTLPRYHLSSTENPDGNYPRLLLEVAGDNVQLNFPVTGVKINEEDVNVYVGDTLELTTTISPWNASNENVSWSSLNTGVATISSSGVVSGLTAGSAKIVVETEDGGHTDTVDVTVKNIPTNTLPWIENFNGLVNGTTFEEGTDTDWSISEGTPSRTFSVQNDTFAANELDVTMIWYSEVIGITGSETNISVDVSYGGSIDRFDSVKVYYILNGGDPILIESVIGSTGLPKTISAGGITGSTVQVVIRVFNTGSDEFYYFDNVEVKEPAAIVPVTGVSINEGDQSIHVNGTVNLSATVSPSGATNKTVTWISSNSSVAVVDSSIGVVTGTSAGSAIITVTTDDGSLTDNITVTVTESVIPVTRVSIDQPDTTVTVKDTIVLSATVAPSNASNQKITWSSADTNIAVVDSLSGEVTGVAKGTVNIIVTTKDEGHTDTVSVVVTDIETRVLTTRGENTRINIYPNPAGNQNVNLQFFGYKKTDDVQVNVYNILGKMVYGAIYRVTGNEEHVMTIPANAFAKGIYMITVQGNHHVKYKRLVIE